MIPFVTSEITDLDPYKKALQREKMFLMNEGGRKYKVTNGKLMGNAKGLYSYIFDLETELHISDDAPISVIAESKKASGSVLMCEDFQIIVLLDENLGNRINVAFISVEPWKLLEAIENRLIHINGSNGKIVSKILSEGPGLATKHPIEKIEKGQDAVIARAMREPVTIVWGPPGTGKTHTMSEIAIQFLEKGKSVLIVSHSNVSVDGVARKIDELLNNKGKETILAKGKVLRYGYIRDEELNKNPYINSFYYTVKENKELSEKLDKLQEEYDKIRHTNGLASQRIVEIRKEISRIRAVIRTEEQKKVSKADIVATTISKVVIDKIFEERKFDVVMFDEVSMAYVLQVVCAATFAKEHLICVGDFMQLAPIAQSPAKDVLCRDIFTHLGINVNGTPYYHPWLVMLYEQRRMHPKIAEFSNRFVYKQLLKNHESVMTSRNEIVEKELFADYPINLLDLFATYCAAGKNADNSRFNILSAFISFACAVHTEKNVDTVSIITPYAAQTRLIRALVLDYRQSGETRIRCSTVHQFQGSESDVVFFDAVESYPGKKPGWLMGKDLESIKRLINVAVTRAKGKLIVVANSKFWIDNFEGTSHVFYRLIKHLQENGNIVQYLEDRNMVDLISKLSVKGGPQFYLEDEQYIQQFEKDMERARWKIVVSIPDGELYEISEKIYVLLQEAQNRGIQVLVKAESVDKLPKKWQEFAWDAENAIFPLVMIDERITWYGIPRAKWKFKAQKMAYLTPCNVVCRVAGEHTAELIRSLTDIEYRETTAGKTKMMSKERQAEHRVMSGLAAYVEATRKCQSCKKVLELSKGKSGKTILWCNECRKTELLSPEEINNYIYQKNVICPEHHGRVKAGLGKWGLYVRCDCGHFLKPDEI